MCRKDLHFFNPSDPPKSKTLGTIMEAKACPGDFSRRAIILAGGEGTRLRELTQQIAGFQVPKQFCPLLGEIPLLEQTRRRVSLSVSPERISFVLNRDHERFFHRFSRASPDRISWCNRETEVQHQPSFMRSCVLRSLSRELRCC
jgi:nucleotidyltransferase-like protein